MKRFNIKWSVIIIAVVIVLASAALIMMGRFSVPTNVTSKDNKAVKELKLSGSNIQSGFAVTLGDYVYFQNEADDSKIYKIKADGSGKAKVCDDIASEMVLADNWIFYVNKSDDCKLYRINVDGTDRVKIAEDSVNNITASTSGIYYSNSNNADRLYHIGFDGKQRKKLNDDRTTYTNVLGDSVVYRNGSQQVISINPDGTGRTVLEEEKVSFVRADKDGNIYCSIQSDNRSLYSLNKDGGSSTKILSTSTMDAQPLGEWIYFTNLESKNPNIYPSFIYRVKKDGTNIQRISAEQSDAFCIRGDKIFYKSMENGEKIYIMNLDGSCRKALEGKTVANSVSEICAALKDNIEFDVTDSKTSQAYKKAKEVTAAIILPDMIDLEKELAIHDYLVKNVKYDHEVTNALNNNIVLNLDSHGAYNVLINGVGVCDGFAWTTKLLLGISGIESDIITGTGKTKDTNKNTVIPIYHAWNIVKINNEYFQLDVTWDENIYEQLGMFSYKYFNVSDSVISADHEWTEGIYTKCSSTKYDFFAKLEMATRDGATLYYSKGSDNYMMYKVNIDGSGDKRINNHKSLFIAVSGGWIYYSDYEDGGALYKMTTDGNSKTMLCSDWCINITVKDGYVEYVKHDDNKPYKLKI